MNTTVTVSSKIILEEINTKCDYILGSDVVEVPMAPPAPKITHSPPRSSSPIPENGAGDCLSIEETNKLRLKLGLKPLEVSSTTSKDPQKTNESGESMIKDEWGEFFHKPAANIGDKKEADKIREKLQERKQKRALEEKLKRVSSKCFIFWLSCYRNVQFFRLKPWVKMMKMMMHHHG